MNMYSLFRTIAIAALLAGLLGCAGPQVSESTSLSDVKDKGIAIVSVTHDYTTGARANAIFYLKNDQTFGAFEQRQLHSRPNIAGIPRRSDFSGVYGQVYVLQMDPGSYQIAGWMTRNGALHASPRYPPPPLHFDIKAGEVIYIGNLNLNHSMGRSLFGIPVLASVMAEVRNHETADIPIAEQKAPLVKGRVVSRLLPIGPWHGGNTDMDQTNELPTVPNQPAGSRI